MDDAPMICLSTGVYILNFSSPHEFQFDNGQVLPACTEARSRALSLEAKEVEYPAVHGTDIVLNFSLTDAVQVELEALQRKAETSATAMLVLVPLPVMQGLKAEWRLSSNQVRHTPFRCVRTADRVTKVIYHNRFCI